MTRRTTTTTRPAARAAATALAAAAALVPAAPAAAAPAAPAPTATAPAAAPARGAWSDGPRPVGRFAAAVDAGRPAWIRVWWRTGRPACDVRVRVTGPTPVAVTYPADRAFSSLSRDDRLDRGETDYTALRVTAPAGRTGWTVLPATVSWTGCGPAGPERARLTGLLLRVR